MTWVINGRGQETLGQTQRPHMVSPMADEQGHPCLTSPGDLVGHAKVSRNLLLLPGTAQPVARRDGGGFGEITIKAPNQALPP